MDVTARKTMVTGNSHHPTIRTIARFFSYLFHPLFIPVYIGLFAIYELNLIPVGGWDKTRHVIMFVSYYSFFPLIVTLLLKALNFIESIHLKTRKDRIIPYVVCEIFYFWAWYVFKNLDTTPDEIVMLSFAIFLACSLGLILNSYMKISMHAIAVGVLAAFVVLAGMMSGRSFGIYISIALLIAGITLTSRLIDSDHSQKEIYFGFFCGAGMQVLAYFYLYI
jgi:hypothetical protein